MKKITVIPIIILLIITACLTNDNEDLDNKNSLPQISKNDVSYTKSKDYNKLEKLAYMLNMDLSELETSFKEVSKYKENLIIQIKKDEIDKENFEILLDSKLLEYFDEEQIATINSYFDSFNKNKEFSKEEIQQIKQKKADYLGMTLEEMDSVFNEIGTFKENLLSQLESNEITKEQFKKLLDEKLSELLTEEQIKKLFSLYKKHK